MTTQLQAVARVLGSLEGGELRARKAAAILSSLDAGEAVALLGELLRKAGQRSDPHSAALEGLLVALRTLLEEPRRDALLQAAEAAHEPEVQALLARTAPARTFDDERWEWSDRAMRAVTLGERRAMAKRHDRDLLARLAADQDLLVIRHILSNPRCTEREVLLIAARRPQRVELLEEIFRSRRWSTNHRVRRALALNPYSPPDLATAALALLTSPDLREVAGDLSITTEVRAQARRLIAQRSGKPAAE